MNDTYKFHLKYGHQKSSLTYSTNPSYHENTYFTVYTKKYILLGKITTWDG